MSAFLNFLFFDYFKWTFVTFWSNDLSFEAVV